jgi:hypothetical protein
MVGNLIYPLADNVSILIDDHSGKRQTTGFYIANSQINGAFATGAYSGERDRSFRGS